jgi:hypothetical protein
LHLFVFLSLLLFTCSLHSSQFLSRLELLGGSLSLLPLLAPPQLSISLSNFVCLFLASFGSGKLFEESSLIKR